MSLSLFVIILNNFEDQDLKKIKIALVSFIISSDQEHIQGGV